MKSRKQPYYLIAFMPILYVFLAYIVARLVENSGVYPSGVDTLCHLYKGSVLYNAIREGDLWPAYDRLWYNGVEMLRYWAPLPVYVLAMCQFLGGGSPMRGFLVFVMFIFIAGALVWLFVGFRLKRPFLGAFLGILWFFMPNNLIALFYEGNLPRSICIVILPLLMYWIYDYLRQPRWQTLPKLSFCFALTALCHSGYAGMILIAFLVYFTVDIVIYRMWRRCGEALLALVLGYMLIGAWLVPSLIGGITSTDSSEIMAGFFQSLLLSVNPAARFTRGCVDFYFGLAALLLALFGIFMSRKKSMPGFWTGVIILICTSNTLYLVLAKLPGGQFLWMLRFISIALCMILFSFLIWDSLKKGWIVLFSVLLVLDALPSLPLIVGSQSGETPDEIMASYSDWTLIGEAKEMTQQRIALIDESAMDAMSAYLLTGYGKPVATTYGAAWQSCTTATNFKQIDRSLEDGSYLYMFDRCLEMGNDTVVVRLAVVKDLVNHPVEQMDEAAKRVGYRLVDYNDGYRFYKLDVDGCWGTVTKYRAVGIGTAAPGIARAFPVVEEVDSTNLNDFTFEELCGYDLIYLAGFTYDDKTAAEELITRLSESGVHIVIAADGIPEDRGSQSQSFLGVVCSQISFSQGYPDLATEEGVLETDLFPDGYREWNTVYVNGLDEVWGTVDDLEWNLPFYGTVKNDHIVVIGLNLTYYYGLTEDEGVGRLLAKAMDMSPQELPERQIVPYTIRYTPDDITIQCGRDDVNTALAYHDSFSASQEIYARNHLTFVKAGSTVIAITCPYLKQGIAVSAVAAVLLAGYAFLMRARLAKPGKGSEVRK